MFAFTMQLIFMQFKNYFKCVSDCLFEEKKKEWARYIFTAAEWKLRALWLVICAHLSWKQSQINSRLHDTDVLLSLQYI